MMSSTLCAYWPFGYPLLWNAHPGLLPTFYLSFTYRFLGIIYIFYIQVLCWIYAWQISSLKDLLFYYLNMMKSDLSTISFMNYAFHILFKKYSPGLCGSVDWVLAYEPKGHQFNSQSGYMPCGLLWGHTRGNHTLMFLSLSFPIPCSLSKNK